MSSVVDEQEVTAAAAPSLDRVAVLERVAHLVGDVLGEDVAGDEPLMEAGLDSLAAVELRSSPDLRGEVERNLRGSFRTNSPKPELYEMV